MKNWVDAFIYRHNQLVCYLTNMLQYQEWTKISHDQFLVSAESNKVLSIVMQLYKDQTSNRILNFNALYIHKVFHPDLRGR